MSLRITEQKIQQSARQLDEAHSDNVICITLKNLKKERAKHLKEIAIAKNRQQSPIGYCNNSDIRSRRRDSKGDIQDDNSVQKLLEIENQLLRSCKNQRGGQSLPKSGLASNCSAEIITGQGKNQDKQFHNVKNQQQQVKLQRKEVKKDKENRNYLDEKHQVIEENSNQIKGVSQLDKNNIKTVFSLQNENNTLFKQQSCREIPATCSNNHILDAKRLSKNDLENKMKSICGQETKNKQKRVHSAQGLASGSQQSQHQQLSNVVLHNSYNNEQDNLSAKNKQTFQEIQKQEDGSSSQASRHRIPVASASELRLKRIRQQNASKSRILLAQSSNEQVERQKNEFNQNIMESRVDGYSGSQEEGGLKKRIIGHNQLQNQAKFFNDEKTSDNESQSKAYLDIQSDEIKGYIKGLMKVLNNIDNSSKQTIKQDNTPNQIDNNQIISKSQETHQDLNCKGVVKKQEYNALKYGYSQGMSSEILKSVIIKKKESSTDHLESHNHCSLSPNNKLEKENDKNSKQKQQQQIIDMNQCSWFQSIENKKDCLKSSQILYKPPQAIKKEQKINVLQQSNHQDEQAILKRHSKSIQNNQNLEKQNDCEDLQKDFQKEGLIKIHSGRNVIKTINPYRSATSLEQFRKHQVNSGINPNLKPSKNILNEGTMEGQEQNIIQKIRSKTYYQSSNDLHGDTAKRRVNQETKKISSLAIEDVSSQVRKYSIISNAETVHTDMNQNNKQNGNSVKQNDNYGTFKENENKSCLLFKDRQSNDSNIKGDSIDRNPTKVCQKQQELISFKSNQECSGDNTNTISKQTKTQNNSNLNDQYQDQYNIMKVQSQESGRNISKKPPTHKQLLKKTNECVQNDQLSIQQQQQHQLAQNLIQIPNPQFNQITKLSKQSSRRRITSVQGVPSNNEVIHSMKQSNNQQDQNCNLPSSYENINNNSCERILDLLLLNTHELKIKFQEQSQQQQQTFAKKNRSKSTLNNCQSHISSSINVVQQFAEKLFSEGCKFS